MKTHMLKSALLVMCSLGAAFGCGGVAAPGGIFGEAEPGDGIESTGSVEQAILNATIVPVNKRTALELSVVRLDGGGCAGTLIRPNWVLTARHCLLDPNGTGALKASMPISHDKYPTNVQNATAFFVHPDHTVDAALIRLATPIRAGQPGSVPLFTGGDPDIENKDVTTYGYGGVSDLSRKTIRCTGVERGLMNSSLRYVGKYLKIGETTGGDSGGPSFINGQLVGLTGSVDEKAYAKSFRNWVNGIVSPAKNNRIDTARVAIASNIAPVGSVLRTGDVNGDGYVDLIQFNRDLSPQGSVYVMLGSKSGFQTMTRWHTWFCVGTEIPEVADVDGDGKDDIITFRQSDGYVYVALSNGSTGFGSASVWHTGFSFSGETPRVGDMNGDGRADLVTFVHYNNWGAVWVALSCGTDPALLPPSAGCTSVNKFGGGTVDTRQAWQAGGFSLLNEVPRVGDVNGDGLADLVTFGSGAAYVALTKLQTCSDSSQCGCWTLQGVCPASLGQTSGPKTLWGSGYHPELGETPMLADMDGDGYTDAVNFETVTGSRNGSVGVGRSNGSTAFGTYHTWGSNFCRKGEVCAVGDKNRDGRADVFDFIPAGADVYSLSLP